MAIKQEQHPKKGQEGKRGNMETLTQELLRKPRECMVSLTSAQVRDLKANKVVSGVEIINDSTQIKVGDQLALQQLGGERLGFIKVLKTEGKGSLDGNKTTLKIKYTIQRV